MDGFTLMLIVLAVLFVGGILVAAVLRPKGSQGDPGEVVGDAPLSSDTPAEWDGTAHKGGAEDRPAGPDVEPMDADEFVAPEVEHPDRGRAS